MTGYLFDFNGTCIFDGRYHDMAWRDTISSLIGRRITDEEIRKYIYGTNNKDIVKHFFGKDVSEEEAREISDGKEEMYRRLLSESGDAKLAPGLTEFFERLKSEDKKLAIVSAANRANFEFYFDVFDLSKWFTWESIVYDDGKRRGKPFPDMWLEASRRLDVAPEDSVVFEDSLNGILAAKRAVVAKIVAVTGDSDIVTLKDQGIADHYIKDYEDEVFINCCF